VRLDPASVHPDPVAQLRDWYEDAVARGAVQPEAMTVATVDDDGEPDARTVLLRGFAPDGVVFYTNLASAKGRHLASRPYAAAVLHWRETGRQVRLRGPVRPVDDATADRYWATRPRGHQVSAWASPQSEVVAAAELDARVRAVEARFAGRAVPRPSFWGGYVVRIDVLELWEHRPDRLHDRVRYRRERGAWVRERLAP
jgi:pyridoxamine 5'-phosphate oxidase